MTPLRVTVFVLVVEYADSRELFSPRRRVLYVLVQDLGDGCLGSVWGSWRVRGLDIRAHSVRFGDSDIVGPELT